MLTATKPYAERWLGPGGRFAAHAPLYPVCWAYNKVQGLEFNDLTGAPVFIQCGELDAHDLPGAGDRLARAIEAIAPGVVSAVTYAGATHAFDRSDPAITVSDPVAHGGKVLFAPHLEAAARARAASLAFFRRAFGQG
jgi:dienelactone hydrolase